MPLFRDRIRRLITGSRDARPANTPVRLVPENPSCGRVLMSYATKAYHDLLQGKPLDRTHVSAWQNFQISRAFLDLGFEVEVFHFEDGLYEPTGSYDVIFDVVSNLGRLADGQGSETAKILFPMFAHWTVHNFRSYLRHRGITERRGVAIAPRRLLRPNDSVERADHILCKGGEFGRSTYDYSSTTVTPVTQLRPHANDEFIVRNPDRCRGNFIWIGGSSAVHKGLDLVLEAFAARPDLELTVLGKVIEEKSFCEVYRRELFESENIRAVGWVDTLSPQFREICENAIGLIAPSATELSCGSVIAGMMNGLIPVVCESTDVDVSEFGICVASDTVDEIGRAIDELAAMPAPELNARSEAARQASQERYGGEFFLATFRSAICDALGMAAPSLWDSKTDELRVPRIEVL